MKWREVPRPYTDHIEALQALLAKDPYGVLGVTQSVSDDELKRAYRLKVRAYHPDKQSPFVRHHAQEVLKVINVAYERIRVARGS
ncbi:MAG: hypothetical protein AMXMBFR37_26980 [Steroidobacteraceae bacterium]